TEHLSLRAERLTNTAPECTRAEMPFPYIDQKREENQPGLPDGSASSRGTLKMGKEQARGRTSAGLRESKVEAAAPSARRRPNAGAAQPPPRWFGSPVGNHATLTRLRSLGNKIASFRLSILANLVRLERLRRSRSG